MLTDPICGIMQKSTLRRTGLRGTSQAASRSSIDLEKSRESLGHHTASNSIGALSNEHADPTRVPLPESRSSSEPVQGSMSQILPRTSGEHKSAISNRSAREVESTKIAGMSEQPKSEHASEVSIPASEPYPISGGVVVKSNLRSDTKGMIIRPVHNVAARGPVHDYSLPLSIDDSLLAEFRERFSSTSSTADDLMDWLLHQQQDNAAGWRHSLPGSAIFNILQNDTMDFIQTVESFLEQVEANFSKETVVQENLSLWRSRMLRIGTELRYLERSFPKLAGFLTSVSGWQCPTAQGQYEGNKIYDIQSHLLPDIVAEISRLETRIKNSLQDLVSVISLIESKKGIVEAESITKLTELGLSLLRLRNFYQCGLLILSSLFFDPSIFHRDLLWHASQGDQQLQSLALGVFRSCIRRHHLFLRATPPDSRPEFRSLARQTPTKCTRARRDST
jgi:hypothetical protein